MMSKNSEHCETVERELDWLTLSLINGFYAVQFEEIPRYKEWLNEILSKTELIRRVIEDEQANRDW